MSRSPHPELDRLIYKALARKAKTLKELKDESAIWHELRDTTALFERSAEMSRSLQRLKKRGAIVFDRYRRKWEHRPGSRLPRDL